MSDTTLPEANEEPTPRTPSDTIRATWNFSLDQIRANTTHFTPDEQATMIALFRWCIDPLHPLRRGDAAQKLGCSPELLYQLLTGKYRNPDKSPKGPSPELIDTIKNFLSAEAKRCEPTGENFVETPTAKKIFTACNLARESHSPVILYGPSHIGKTWALKNYAANNNHGRTFFAELEAARGLGGMVRCLATACGIPDGIQNTAVLIERIQNALSADTLLIIDEPHLLKHTYRLNSFFACIEVIRRIYDSRQCGMVLSWTNLDNLKSASQAELVQLWRRGVHKVGLPVMPTKADLTAILAHHGLAFPDSKMQVRIGKVVESPYEILRQQARNNGLKAITERVRYARKLAGKGNAAVTWEYFVDAHLRIEKQAVQEGEWN